MRRTRARLVALGIGVAVLSSGSVALADLIDGDLHNDVDGLVQRSATYTRASFPAEDTSYWWIEPRDRDPVDGCNADAANPVTITIHATPGVDFWDGSAWVPGEGTVQRTSCETATGGVMPANASQLRYRLGAAMPLGRTTLSGSGTGGKTTSAGKPGTFVTKTLNINVNPRNPSGLGSAAAGLGKVDLTWTQSADDADLTGYQIRRRTSDGAYADWTSPLDQVTGSAYRDLTVDPGVTYCYQVRAVFIQTVGTSTVTFPSGQTAESCVTTAANHAPTAPGAPELTAGSTNPNNDGVHRLTWTGATDPDGDPITYVLQHRDGNDADWQTVGTTSDTTYAFQSFAPEEEGTWTYRVQASDGVASSAFSDPGSTPVKVDKSTPLAPLADAGAADYTAPDGTAWYRDQATVRFAPSSATANGDRDLQDGTAGTGVRSVSDPLPFTVSGPHVATGKAIDAVGLESDPTSLTVNVDADAPKAALSGCAGTESTPALVKAGAVISLGVTGSDAESGLRSLTASQDGATPTAAASGSSVQMDTSRSGRHTLTLTATDNVATGAGDDRHVATGACTVFVYSKTIVMSCGSASFEMDTSTTSLSRWTTWAMTVSRWVRTCGWITVRLPDGRECRIDLQMIVRFIAHRR